MSKVRHSIVMDICNMEDCRAKEPRPRRCVQLTGDHVVPGMTCKITVCLSCLDRLVTEHLTHEEMPMKEVEDI